MSFHLWVNSMLFLFQEIVLGAAPVRSLVGHTDRISQVLFLPDGRLASCASSDSIRIWNLEKESENFELRGPKWSVYSLAVLPNGWLASCSLDGKIKIWDLDKREEIRSLKFYAKTLAVLKNGNLVSFSTNSEIRIWNPYSDENNLLLTFITDEVYTFPKRSFIAVLSNDNIATCIFDPDWLSEVRIWDSKDGELVKSVSTGYNEIACMLLTFNDQVALATACGSIVLLDLAGDGEAQVREGEVESCIRDLAKLSKGYLLSSGINSSSTPEVKVWDLRDLSLIQTVIIDESCEIYEMSVSPDEKLLTGCGLYNSIKIWPSYINF